MTTLHAMPDPLPGHEACRTWDGGGRSQTTHLVALDEKGSNGGRPTVCGLSRFDRYSSDGRSIPGTADLPGWSMGGGLSGPGVIQVRCPGCYATTAKEARP